MAIQTTLSESILLLSIDMGRGNAINQAFIDAFHQALDEAERARARAVIITGVGRTFCGGLDLLSTYDHDRGQISAFVDAFDSLFLRIFTHGAPVIAAINGSAIAGGSILAMAADYRIMARGPFVIGVNEALLGLPFPSASLEIARHALPRTAWTEAFYEGKRYAPEEAHAAGLVHRLTDEERLLTEATKQARTLTRAGAQALSTIKAALLAPTVARIEATALQSRATFVDQWFGLQARERIGELVAALLARKGLKN